MNESELEQAVLNFISQVEYRPMKPRAIAKQLQVPEEKIADLKRAVKRLVHHGRLQYGSNHLVVAVKQGVAAGKTSSGRITGVFQRTKKGFGFVRPHGATSEDREKTDLYIPADRAGDASTGDTVLAQLLKHRPGEPGLRGEIVEIIERETHQFVGTYFESRGAGYVQVDGTLFAQPISVGDPGAKNARTDDKVVFEMVRFPSPYHDGEGVITEVLGPSGKPGVDTLSILREFDLPEAFPEDALEEARLQADRFDESIPKDRLDLTGETVITIDPEDARDFDDAISLRRLNGGNWLLGVHIADVTHFVRPKTAIDRVARERATSVYLPDRVIPMLPETISNSLASLQPGKVRYCKSAILEFTKEGIRTSTELRFSAIKSAKRLNYEQVDGFLHDPEAWRKKLGAKVFALLGLMRDLARTLRRRRMRNGALELTLPEVKIDLDKNGRVNGAHVVENTESHQVIEEFMLAANEAVAERLRDKEIRFLRRIHQSPSPRKLKALTEFVKELGYDVASLESRFELQKLLKMSAGRPDQHAVNFAVLRSLQRAVYSPMEEGHYALASDCYCHFTSPIRRYPDLTVHRLVESLLTGKKPRNVVDDLVVLGQHCSDREQRAEAAERELTKLKLLSYLSQRIGLEMEAVVTGVESFGIFVQGLELPAEGLVHVDSLTDDYYRFDRANHTLAGHRAGNSYRLGDLLKVAVARVDMERRELDFRLVEKKKTAKGVKPAKDLRKTSQKKSKKSRRR
ncbi:MAG: ribonuclease R [Thermoguttaceae bacterium]|jgi:ribonuclease R